MVQILAAPNNTNTRSGTVHVAKIADFLDTDNFQQHQNFPAPKSLARTVTKGATEFLADSNSQ